MYDWQPLHCGDPFPGSPDAITNLTDDMRKMRRVLADCSDTLGNPTSEFWNSPAGKSFQGELGNLPNILKALEARYDAAIENIQQWGRKLDESTTAGQKLAAQARDLEDEAQAARSAQNEYVESLNNANSPDSPELDPSMSYYANVLSENNEQMQTLRTRLKRLIEEAESTAKCLGAALREACDDAIKNKGGLRGFLENHVAPFLEKLEKILEVVSTFVAVIALVACLAGCAIPGLNIIAAGLAAATFVCVASRFVNKNNSSTDRKATLGELVESGAGAVAGVGGLGASASTARTAAGVTSKASKVTTVFKAVEKSSTAVEAMARIYNTGGDSLLDNRAAALSVISTFVPGKAGKPIETIGDATDLASKVFDIKEPSLVNGLSVPMIRSTASTIYEAARGGQVGCLPYPPGLPEPLVTATSSLADRLAGPVDRSADFAAQPAMAGSK